MSEKEREAATAQGAMTGLFDDFFDKQYMPDDSIEKMLSEEDPIAKKSNEKLFGFFYKKALAHVPDKKTMLNALRDVYKAQLESRKQTQPHIGQTEIEAITFYKGGSSLLFYRTAFLPVPSPEEKKLLYDLGSLMQLSNDIFDVYKDRKNGIRTLITETDHIKPIRELLQQQVSACYKYAYETGFKKKNVSQFLSLLSLGIFSRAFVCLDKLEQNEKLTQSKFSVHEYSRKQLVCDMDTIKNKLRSVYYHSKLVK